MYQKQFYDKIEKRQSAISNWKKLRSRLQLTRIHGIRKVNQKSFKRFHSIRIKKIPKDFERFQRFFKELEEFAAKKKKMV